MEDKQRGLFIKLMPHAGASTDPYRVLKVANLKLSTDHPAGSTVRLTLSFDISDAIFQHEPMEFEEIKKKCANEKEPYAFLKFTDSGSTIGNTAGLEMMMTGGVDKANPSATISLGFKSDGGKVNNSAG